MKRIFLGLLAITVIAISCKDETKPSDVAAATTQPEKELTKEEQDKAWMAYMTPGEMHKWMAKGDGTWEGDIQMWMNPDSPAMKVKGVATFKTVLGGRYQEGVHTGEMMGMPFEGRSLLAYDNAKKVFISSWIDNMGTGFMNMEGTYDAATKTMNMKGTMVDPATGKDCPVREVVTFVDDNTQKMAMYCTMKGKEMKTMEMVSKRKM
jgi:hypothetical protein